MSLLGYNIANLRLDTRFDERQCIVRILRLSCRRPVEIHVKVTKTVYFSSTTRTRYPPNTVDSNHPFWSCSSNTVKQSAPRTTCKKKSSSNCAIFNLLRVASPSRHDPPLIPYPWQMSYNHKWGNWKMRRRRCSVTGMKIVCTTLTIRMMSCASIVSYTICFALRF